MRRNAFERLLQDFFVAKIARRAHHLGERLANGVRMPSTVERPRDLQHRSKAADRDAHVVERVIVAALDDARHRRDERRIELTKLLRNVRPSRRRPAACRRAVRRFGVFVIPRHDVLRFT